MTPEQKNQGYPHKFNPELYCDAVEQMIEADELERAFWMLDNMPGYYRENPYDRAVKMKSTLYQRIVTVKDYIEDKDECDDAKTREIIDSTFTYPRFDVIHDEIIGLNNKGIVPFITELGPANFWLPKMLQSSGADFTYKPISINKEATRKFYSENEINGRSLPYKIFVCFEVIEHLWNPNDIVHFYHKEQIDFDMIFLSTPHNTLLGGSLEPWHTRGLGHLRTYTQQEFLEFAFKSFPGREWEMTPSQMMVLKGKKIATTL